VPQPGDDVVFPASAAQQTNINDLLAGTAFNSVRLDGQRYVITGNAITLAAGITANAQGESSNPEVGLDITLTAPQTFSAADGSGLRLSGGIDLNGQTLTVSPHTVGDARFFHAIEFAGTLRGAGGLVVNGEGQVSMGTRAHTYTGLTDIRSGGVTIWHTAGLGAAGVGNETIVGRDAALFVGMLVTTDRNIPESITFAGHPAGTPSLQGGGQGGGVNFTGNVTLAGPNYFVLNNVVFNGVVGETGGPQELTLYAGSQGSAFKGRIDFTPGSVIAYTGGTKILHGQVRFDGTGTGAVSVTDGVIGGNGTIGPVTIGSGSGISPALNVFFVFFPNNELPIGTDPLSTLTIRGDLTFPDNGSQGLAIQNFLPDGRSDRVSVQGAVRLAGPLSVPQSGSGDAIPAGTRFRIVDNDGTDPVVGTFSFRAEGEIVGAVGGRYLRITYHGGDGNDVELVADAVVSPGRLAVGAGPGGLPLVNYYDGGGTRIRSFLAYDAGFRGGVRVVTTDMNRDGVADIITAPGPGGGPHVKLFDGVTGQVLSEFMAYDAAFRGGVFLAAGEIFGPTDGIPDIVTGAGPGGGPHVKAFEGSNLSAGNVVVEASFFAYDARFTGGVTVAAIDTEGPNFAAYIVTGPASNFAPLVRVFHVTGPRLVSEFFAYDSRFTGGVYVATGDVDRNGRKDIITGTGPGGGPHVRAFGTLSGAVLGEFFAYAPAFFGGVVVDALDVDGDGRAEIVTGPGPGGGPHIRVFDLTGVVRREWFAFDPSFTGGVFIG